jgi:hypothetical protein
LERAMKRRRGEARSRGEESYNEEDSADGAAGALERF